MEVQTSDRPTFDAVLKEISRELKGTEETINIRIQPQTYSPSKGYLGWPGISWTVRCGQAEEVKEFRACLDEFFDALGRRGPVEVAGVLKALQ